jgi:hypothetical protein
MLHSITNTQTGNIGLATDNELGRRATLGTTMGVVGPDGLGAVALAAEISVPLNAAAEARKIAF